MEICMTTLFTSSPLQLQQQLSSVQIKNTVAWRVLTAYSQFIQAAFV